MLSHMMGNNQLHGCVTTIRIIFSDINIFFFYSTLYIISALAHCSCLHQSVALELEPLGSLSEH